MHEFELIKKYFSKISSDNKFALNLNDDVFFDKKNDLVVSVDTYNEGTHFLNFKKQNKKSYIFYFKPTRPTPNRYGRRTSRTLHPFCCKNNILLKYKEMKYPVAQKINYNHQSSSPPPLPISNSINSNFKFDIC